MSQRAPKVSVIIATYQPGDAIMRVVDSLDAQTLPQDEFEVVFVDDGSPDDTLDRLRQIAAARANVRVFQIKNSGWPSKPRNVGLEHARGEYLMFMDHDDSLYPDALRRAYEYAKENNADILSPKESKSNDVFWGLPALADGNIPNAVGNGGIDRLVPMVPHKLYRRQMFQDHQIRFPERARALWEDIFINVGAYRYAKVVSILADTPCYLWHASSRNNSHTFDPAREDFWDRLEDMMRFIESTLDTPQLRDAQVSMLARQVSGRVLNRLVRLLTEADPPTARMAMGRARRLLARFTTDRVFDALLSKKHQAQAFLLRRGDAQLLRAFHAIDRASAASVSTRSAQWRDGRLHMEIESRWGPGRRGRPMLERRGTRVRLAVTPELERAIPPEYLDVTDDLHALVLTLGVRSRTGHVTWAVPYEATETTFADDESGRLALVEHGVCVVDPQAAALGAALADDVWDCRHRIEWVGRVRKAAVRFDVHPLPALVAGRAAVAYSNTAKGLSIDLAQKLRTFAVDARPKAGPAGPVEAFSVPLENVAVAAEGVLAADMMVAVPAAEAPDDPSAEHAADILEKLAANGALGARIVAGRGGARLEGGASLAPGRYLVYARRDGKLLRTWLSLVVDENRQVAFLH